jgi:hypothetical protein
MSQPGGREAAMSQPSGREAATNQREGPAKPLTA